MSALHISKHVFKAFRDNGCFLVCHHCFRFLKIFSTMFRTLESEKLHLSVENPVFASFRGKGLQQVKEQRDKENLRSACFPDGPVVKNRSAKAEDLGDVDWIPGSGRSPGRGHGYPLQYSCLENPMDRGAWRAIVHGVTKSQT